MDGKDMHFVLLAMLCLSPFLIKGTQGSSSPSPSPSSSSSSPPTSPPTSPSPSSSSSSSPLECHPCPNTDLYVQCSSSSSAWPNREQQEGEDANRSEDDQCPSFLTVNEDRDPPLPLQNCPLPMTTTASATAASGDVGDDDDGASNSTYRAEDGMNSTTQPPTTDFADTTTPSSQALTANLENDTFQPTNYSTPITSSSRTPGKNDDIILCGVCVTHCRTCDGSKCVLCKKEYELHSSSSNSDSSVCVLKEKKEDSEGGLSIALIAGVAAGGGVVVVVAVVVVCCCCCRRRRRREEGRGGMDDILARRKKGEKQERNTDRSVEEGGGGEWRGGGVGGGETHKRVAGVDFPDYVNVSSAMPRPISIERGHDKVTRYVRDPTTRKPEPSFHIAAEEHELAQLPTAPLPPDQGAPRKRSIDGGQPLQQQDSDTPTPTTTTPTHHPHPSQKPYRSHASGLNKADSRSAGFLAGKASTLSVQSGFPSSSVGDLPRFPIEEELERQQEREASGEGRIRGGGGGGRGVLKEKEEELEEPETNYENLVGSRAKLQETERVDDDHEGMRSSSSTGGGLFNPALNVEEEEGNKEKVEEEPEDDYMNQAAIAESLEQNVNDDDDENVYQNWSRSGFR